MDDADRADSDIEVLLAYQINVARKAPPPMPAVGQCYNCHEGVPPGHRFCDSDCEQDYQRRKRSLYG